MFDDPYEGVCYYSGNGHYEVIYTGAAITPLIKVTSEADGELREGIDYTVSYSNNKNVSKQDKPATIRINGKGNFCGTLKDVPVKVISKDDKKNGAIKVNLKAAQHVYNGEAHKLSVTTEKETGELTVTAGSSKTAGFSINTMRFELFELIFRK